MRYLLSYLFCVSTCMDFLTTYLFMDGRVQPDLEANPVAAWALAYGGFEGLGLLVAAVDLLAVTAALTIHRYQPRCALVSLGFMVCVSNAVVVHNLLFLAGVYG